MRDLRPQSGSKSPQLPTVHDALYGSWSIYKKAKTAVVPQPRSARRRAEAAPDKPDYHVETGATKKPRPLADRGFVRLGPDRKRPPYGPRSASGSLLSRREGYPRLALPRSHGAEALSPFGAYLAWSPGGRVTPRSGVFPGQSKPWLIWTSSG